MNQELQEATLFFGKMTVKISWINPAQKWEILIDLTKKVPKIELWREMNTEKLKFGSPTHFLFRDWDDLFWNNSTWATQINP